jgi:ribonucleotide reductase beta subunit family protein with ferritin-like domain
MKKSIFDRSTSYRPFKYPQFVKLEQEHRIDMHWHENQVSLVDDLRQFNSVDWLATKDVSHEVNKNMLEKMLLVFAEMDSVVGEGYCKLLPHVGNNEVRMLLMTQSAREITHARSYALAAESFGFTESDWSEFKEYEEMNDKIELMSTFDDDLSNKLNWCKALITILLGEGISLFGAFCSLLNLKRQGLLIGFNDINRWSLLDERVHVENNIAILSEAVKDLSFEEYDELQSFTKLIAKAYVDAEVKFIDIIYENGDQQDLTKEQLKSYINYLRHLRLHQMGMGELINNPLPWMDDMLESGSHDNFFEKRVTDYNHGGLKGDVDYTKYKLTTEEEMLATPTINEFRY